MSITKARTAIAAALGATVLMTAGCETATTYRPATGVGFSREGYSDHQIEANRYEVTFSGNTLTSRDTVDRYLLFRAAELTVQQGFDYFVLANRDTNQETRTYTTPGFGANYYGGYWGPSWRFYGRGAGYGGFGGGFGGFGGYGYRGYNGFYGDPFFNDFDIQTVQRYEASADIIVGHGSKPTDNIRAFDARQVINNLGPTIVVPTKRS